MFKMSLALQLCGEPDITRAREAVRLSAKALDFEERDLRLVLAAVSELSINALEAGGGDLSVNELHRSGCDGISIVINLKGEIKPDLSSLGLGFAGAKRLTDEYELSIRGGRTTIHIIKWRRPSTGIATEYRSLLEYAATHFGEEPVLRAFAFGRRVVLNGLGILDMAAIHRNVMDQMAHIESPHFKTRALECFEEALAAFEMVYRGFPEARNAMRNIHEMLEQEAERMAHTLHDEAAQIIAALSIGIDELECEKSAFTVQTKRLKNMVEEADNLFRGLSHELRPPLLENAGLAAALRALCQSLSSRHGFQVSFHDNLQRRITPSIEKVLYRAAQVGLANVARHAHAQNATVSIGVSARSIVCSVRDDGQGANAGSNPSGGLGLQGVRKRAAALGGTAETEAVWPHGFELRVCLPDPDVQSSPGATADGRRCPGPARLAEAAEGG